MSGVWQSWGGVLLVSAAGLPLAGLMVWALARAWPLRPVRYAVAEVAMVAGTVPWLWMILTPSPGTPRRLSLVPLRDLTQLAPADLVVQIGGNLLVFAALGFFLPIRFAARVPTVLAVAVAGSVTVETLQYVLDLGRVSSVDDVFVNAAGAGLAAVCSLSTGLARRV
ncbi:VanZ family protein [Rugosimonospora africana]|uniref:VanZ family protein n=1 Tax=Rugosimonospora africana TaxID=556532 RepID=UPI001EF22A32|nr:VanZ family protein [Rugosimonospora africana]